MRFIFFFLLFFILSYAPIIFYSLSRGRCKSTGVSIFIKMVLSVIPTAFISYYICSLTGLVRLDTMFVCFLNIVMILFFLPLNAYLLCRAIYVYFRDKKSKDLRWLHKVGATLALVLFVLVVVGVVDKKNVQVRQAEVVLSDLPESFDGLKVVLMSDVHVGNIDGKRDYLNRLTDIVNSYNPDVVMLCGDLVNVEASEGEGIDSTFTGLQAKLGKFAVLGNHDYGKYTKWKCAEDSIKNLDAVKSLYRDLGFDLLLNENRTLVSGEDTLVVAGMENCGEEPFPCYGDMDASLFGAESKPVLLLSHDPSTWKTHILEYENVLMTFSGHTHAAQMGFEIGDFKFSPAQFLYDEWDGLYEKDGKYLFVSRGVGYVGLAFRLGMKPEISVITLVKK